MISQLPQSVQDQALNLLRLGRFIDAKALHDDWFATDLMSQQKYGCESELVL